MAISSFSNPIPDLVQGLLQGHALGLQMHNQKQADQKFKTDQALRQQNMSMQDIFNQQALGEMGRPVSPMGTVTSPGVQSMSTGVPIAGLDTQAGNPDYTRKADASRTVKYTTAQGNKMSTELYTPEEQDQAAANKSQLLKRANSTTLRLSPEDQAKYGLPADFPIPNDHVAQYLNSRVTNDTRQGIADSNNQTKVDTNARTNDTRENNNANTNSTRQDIAATNNITKSDIAAGVQTGANSRNDNTNATRVQVGAGNNAATLGSANIRAAGTGNGRTGQPTPGQAGVQNRFDQKRQDLAQKTISTIQAKENALHAQRLQIGQTLGAMKPADQEAAKAKLNTLGFQIGAYQTQKAKAAGAATPPQDIQSKIPEGQQATGPDGHTWMKKDGITYFVK